ncbi:MAG TPA: hypothetical protein VNG71_15885 [Pyrinomonadaceae bacterium]|nr:hypothetical protein [Pyrinomonadaceae bacterium]
MKKACASKRFGMSTRALSMTCLSGLIMLAGPFVPEGTGALVVLNVETTEEARTIYAKDPWAHQDILHLAEVKEWTIFLAAHGPLLTPSL